MNQLSFSTDFLVESGHFQYHASVLTRRFNPKASETIPAILLEAENSRCSAGTCCRETKTQSCLDTTASVQAQPTVRLKKGGVINKDACLQNNSNDDLKSLIRSASPADHRSELIPVTITPEMAKGYLSFGVEQEREIDQAVTEDYALSMQNGEWKAGSILIFSEDYKIIDGYYRLAAVAQSGVPAEFYLVRGVPSNL